MPQSVRLLTFQLDHVRPRQHGGDDSPANLALSCGRCNRHKGPNLSGVDGLTGQIAPLFNPRQDSWSEHFRVEQGAILGITPTGRATVATLNLNHPEEVAVREEMARGRLWPPPRD